MSRVGTQPQSQFGGTQTSGQTGTLGQTSQQTNTQSFRERVAQRAYEKWVKRGCKHGCDRQDWFDAEAEVLAEQNRSSNTGSGYYR
jgi:hypothetical protein